MRQGVVLLSRGMLLLYCGCKWCLNSCRVKIQACACELAGAIDVDAEALSYDFIWNRRISLWSDLIKMGWGIAINNFRRMRAGICE